MVYAVGRLEARFSSLGVEREYSEVAGTDPRALVQATDLRTVLGVRDNRYLARQMCWVFRTTLADVCVIAPRDDADLSELVDALPSSEEEQQVLVGTPAAGVLPWSCSDAGLPVVWVQHLLTFTTAELIDAVAAATSSLDESTDGSDEVDGAAGEAAPATDAAASSQLDRRSLLALYAQLTQRSGNTGLDESSRALNFLALKYPPLYHLVADAAGHGKDLAGVETRVSGRAGRRLVGVRLVFRHQRSHLVERYHCEVDVTDVFPFLAAPLTQVFD